MSATIRELRDLEMRHAELGDRRVKADAQIQRRLEALHEAEADKQAIVRSRIALQEEMAALVDALVGDGVAWRCLRCGHVNEKIDSDSTCKREGCGVEAGQRKKPKK